MLEPEFEIMGQSNEFRSIAYSTPGHFNFDAMWDLGNEGGDSDRGRGKGARPKRDEERGTKT